MPETDIINPTAIWDEVIQDSMCPSYGFTRKRTGTQLRKKAVGGTPWTRETQNTGHSFPLTWTGRSWACVQKIKWYYEQYEDGFFTLIDWDGGGRHYVGHFTSEPNIVESGNGTFDVQSLVFEETPKAPMVEYPGDWDHDAVTFYVSNDWKDQKVATSGTWAQTVRNIEGHPQKTIDDPGTAADWAQFEYRGYGFKLFLMQGPEFGQCQVLLDSVLVKTVDCYAANEVGPQMVCMDRNVYLDIHRVKVIALGTKNASATGAAISWHSLKVMR
jgi:hypothetical protein